MVNQACPKCGSPREPGAAVCGTCLFEFDTADDLVHFLSSSTEPRITQRPIVVAGGSIALGVVVVLGALVIGGRGNGSPIAVDATSSAAASVSRAPAPTSRATPAPSPSSTSAPTSPPMATPSSPAGTSNSDSFAILPAPQPADFVPGITCSGPIGASDPVAIVQLHAAQLTGELVLRDYADTSSPRTVCTMGNQSVTQLIDAHHLVIAHSAFAVVELPEARFHWFQLPRVMDSISEFLAVSPRLDKVVWLKYRVDPNTSMATSREIHITTAAGDHVVASLPDEPVGFCGAPPDFSKRAAYSSSGEHLFVADHPRTLTGGLNAVSSLRVFAGDTAVLSLVPPNAGWPEGDHPAMAVWSPTSETLYYRQGGDVWRWTPASGPTLLLPGVSWNWPTITPDGRHAAYVLVGPDGQFEVYLIDLASGGVPQLIGQAREKPVFLNNTQLWFTTPNVHGCITGDEEPLIYNISDGSESPSIIDWVRVVWPATSAWY